MFLSHTFHRQLFVTIYSLKLSNRMIKELHFLLRLLTERKGRKDEREEEKKGEREGGRNRRREGGPFE